MQELSELYKEKYQDVLLYTMAGNPNGGLPVSIEKVENYRQTAPLHRHEAFQINYITRGSLYHEVNHSRYELSKGHIFIIPPYIPHRMSAADDAGFDYVELEFVPEFIFDTATFSLGHNTSVFDFAFVEPFFVAEQDVCPRLLLTGDKQRAVEALIESIYEEHRTRGDGYMLSIKADLLKLLVLLGRYFEEVTRDDQHSIYRQQREEIMRAIRYIDEHHTEDLTVDDVARISCLSRSYFSCLFKSITGKTLIEYITDLRLKTAAEMLCTTTLPVTDICFSAGFNNINHFNRVFKKEFGLSPLQYRKQNRQ